MEAISIMLNQFPLSPGTDPEKLIRGFMMAVEELPGAAIILTAKLYIRGTVGGHDRRFAPSSASFAETARNQAMRMEYEARPKLKEPPKDHAPEKRVAPEKMALLRAFWRKEITFDQLLVGCGMKQQEG